MREIMRRAVDEVQQVSTERKVDWRTGAYVLAVQRVAAAVQMGHPDF